MSFALAPVQLTARPQERSDRLESLLMAPPELRMSFADPAGLARELDTNLRHGRAFLLGQGGVEVLADCVLVLVHPDSGHELGLLGQVVMVNDSEAFRGVGVQLRPFDAGVVQAIEAFAAGDLNARGTAELAPPPPVPDAAAQSDAAAEDGHDDAFDIHRGLLGEELPEDGAQALADDEEEDGDDGVLAEDGELVDGDDDGDELEHDDADGDDTARSDDAGDAEGELTDGDGEELSGGDEDERAGTDVQRKPRRHEQLRKLNATQQHKLARVAELNDRVLLERIYGKSVWEGLLQNPKLTLPEVARIARKGSVPRPLIEQIVENNSWIQSPLVRRALLSNPRVSHEGILKLLRATPRHELKTIYKTTTYSTTVREAAKKVLDL